MPPGRLMVEIACSTSSKEPMTYKSSGPSSCPRGQKRRLEGFERGEHGLPIPETHRSSPAARGQGDWSMLRIFDSMKNGACEPCPFPEGYL